MVVLFTSNQLVSAAATPAMSAIPAFGSSVDLRRIALNPTQLDIPYDFVNVTEIHQGNSGKLIIHIQDAHANFSGQQSLANTLDYYLSNYHIPLVFVEGGDGDVGLSDIRRTASLDAWGVVAKRFLYEGIISGEEYVNLTQEYNFSLIGIEDMSVYFDSLNIYADIAKTRQRSLDYLHRIQVAVNKLRNHSYPRELIDYEEAKKKRDLVSGFSNQDFDNLLVLANTTKINFLDFREISRFIELRDFEQRIDFGKLNSDQAKLLDALGKRGSSKKVNEFMTEFNKAPRNQMSQLVLLERLTYSLQTIGVDVNSYPDFMGYRQYLKLFSLLDMDNLLKEFEQLEEVVYQTLLSSETAKKVHAISRYLKILENAYQIKMTSREFDVFMANANNFSTDAYQSFVNSELYDLGFVEDMIVYDDILENSQSDLFDFYKSVNVRDDIFVQKAISQMQSNGASVSFLIAGGYHTQNLTKLLKEQDISYVVLTPIVDSTTDSIRYEKLLLSALRSKSDQSAQVEDKTNRTKLGYIRQLVTRMGIGKRLDIFTNAREFAQSRLPANTIESLMRFRPKQPTPKSRMAEAPKELNMKQQAIYADLFERSKLDKGYFALLALGHTYAYLAPQQKKDTLKWLQENSNNGYALEALGYIYKDLTPQQKTDIFDLIVSKIGASNWGAIRALGHAYGDLTSVQKKYTFNLFETHAQQGQVYAFQALGYSYKNLIPQQKKDIFELLQNQASNDGALKTLGYAYKDLPIQPKIDILKLLQKQARASNDGALLALGLAYQYLSSQQKRPTLKILLAEAKKNYAGAFQGLGHAYEHLTPKQRANVYELLHNHTSNWTALEALGYAYKHLSSHQKIDTLKTFEDHALVGHANYTQAPLALGLAFGYIEVDGGGGVAQSMDVTNESSESEYVIESKLSESQRISYNILLANAKADDEEAIGAFGDAYASLDVVERVEVYILLRQKAKVGSQNALWALGKAFVNIGVKEQEKVWRLLYAKAEENHEGGLRGLAAMYTSLDITRQGIVDELLVDKMQKDVNGSKSALADIYPDLPEELQEVVFSSLTEDVLSNGGESILALGYMHAYFDTIQKKTFYNMIYPLAESGDILAMMAMENAYPESVLYHDKLQKILPSAVMDSLAKQFSNQLPDVKIHDLIAIQKAAADGDGAALRALGITFKHQADVSISTTIEKTPTPLNPHPKKLNQTQQETYAILMEKALADQEGALQALGQAHASVTTEQQTETYTLLKTKAEAGSGDALQALGHAHASLTAEQQIQTYALLKFKVKASYPYYSVYALGHAHASLTPEQQTETYTLLKTKAEAGSGDALLALGYAHASLTPEQQIETYTFLKTDAEAGNEDALLALGHAHASLTPEQQIETYTLLKTKAEADDEYALRALGQAHASLTAEQQTETHTLLKTKAQADNWGALLALGHAHASLTPEQQTQTHALLKTIAEAGNRDALLALGQAFTSLQDATQGETINPKTLNKTQQDTYDILIKKAQAGNGDAFWALGQAHVSLTSEQQTDTYDILIKKAQAGIWEALRALGHAHASLTTDQQTQTYVLLESEGQADNAYALEALGHAHASLTTEQQTQTYALLKTKAKAGNAYAIEALGQVHASLTLEQQIETYTLLKNKAEAGNGGALQALGQAHASLTAEQQTQTYALLKTKAEAGNIYAIEALGQAHASLTLEQQTETYTLLKNKAEAGNSETLQALGQAHASLTAEQQTQTYTLLKTIAEAGNTYAIEALGQAHAYLTLEQQTEAYTLLKTEAEEGDSDALWALGHAHASLTTDQQTQTYALLKTKAEAGNRDALLALGQAFTSLQDATQGETINPKTLNKTQEEVYDALIKEAKANNGIALYALGLTYTTLNETQKNETYTLLQNKFTKNTWSTTFARGQIYTDLNETQQIETYLLLQDQAKKDGGIALEALGQVYAALNETQQTETYALLKNKAQADNDDALHALGKVYTTLNETQKAETYTLLQDKSIANNWGALWSLGYIYTTLNETQKAETYTLLQASAQVGSGGALQAIGQVYTDLTQTQKIEAYTLLQDHAKSDSGGAFIALGYAYTGLLKKQKKETYILLRDKAKEGDASALEALALILASLTKKQKTETYMLLRDAAKEGTEDALEALGQVYFLLSLTQKTEIYIYLRNQANEGSLPAWQALGVIFKHLPDNLVSTSAVLAEVKEGLAHDDDTSAFDYSVNREWVLGTGELIATSYKLKDAEPSGNQAGEVVIRMMRQFDEFENANLEVLSLLNQNNRTVGGFHELLFSLEKMVKIYLELFKDQDPSTPLENIAAAPTDLAGGRAIAQIIIRIKQELNVLLKATSGGKASIDLLDSSLETIMQRFDGQKTATLIAKPAEQYSTQELAGVSVAELINIIHQKGIRNLQSLASQGSGQKKTATVTISTSDTAQASVDINVPYLDARQKASQEHPLPIQHLAQSFAQGDLIHQHTKLFPPSNSLILADEKRVVMGMSLGVHSARVQYALMPIQEGGKIVINYTDSGSGYVPGSSVRAQALAEAFEAVGFKVNYSGFHFDAYFDKDTGASSIDQLPEKLTFAIQALSTVRDLDLNINDNTELSGDPVLAVEKIKSQIVKDGFLRRSILSTGNGFTGSLNAETLTDMLDIGQQNQIILTLNQLGASNPSVEPSKRVGQRAQNTLNQRIRLLNARGALDGDQKWSDNYKLAAKVSPIKKFLEKIVNADIDQQLRFRQTAAIAQTIEKIATRRTLGALGRFQVEQLTLPALGDQVVFYVLRDIETGVVELSYAILGEFPYDSPRYDLFRNLPMSNNDLSVGDLKAILEPQHMGHTDALRARIKELDLDLAGQSLSIFNMITNDAYLNQLVPFFDDGLFEQSSSTSGVISPISLGGLPINKGKVLGRVAINAPDKKVDDFKGKIMLAEYTEPEDDGKIKVSGGIIVTTGGELSHAAIRSREHGVPAAILNGANLGASGLVFKRYKGDEQRQEVAIGAKTLSYYEVSDYSEVEQVIGDGDLVYLDAQSGMFYLIASAADTESLEQYDFYTTWKQGALANAQVVDVEELKRIFGTIKNQSLLRAVIDDLLSESILTSQGLEEIMHTLMQNSELKGVAQGLILQKALDEYATFNHQYKNINQLLDQKPNVQEVYLAIDQIVAQAENLARVILLANGQWTQKISPEDIEVKVDEVIKKGSEWLKVYQNALNQRIGSVDAETENQLLRINRFAAELNMAGLDMSIVNPLLFNKLNTLTQLRESEVETQGGRGLLWKADIKDRFARPIVGGKAANSAEITQALFILKQAGVIDDSVDIVTPEGFAIKSEEYLLWDASGRPDAVDDVLRQEVFLAYRDLLAKQVQRIETLIATDERTSDAVKTELLALFMPLDAIVDINEIAGFKALVPVVRSTLKYFLDRVDMDEISESLSNQLRVFGAVAVRSSGLKEDSADEAMAGLKETKLNVSGIEEVLKAIIEVWRSDAEAILIDEMIFPKVSGVAFGVDPVKQKLNDILISAGYGSAKGLVDQIIKNPDTYTVERLSASGQKYHIATKSIGDKAEKVILDIQNGGFVITPLDPDPVHAQRLQAKQALTDQQIDAVARATDLLSQFFGYYGDEEFSFDTDKRLVVLQFRPITTISESAKLGRDILIKGSRLASLFRNLRMDTPQELSLYQSRQATFLPVMTQDALDSARLVEESGAIYAARIAAIPELENEWIASLVPGSRSQSVFIKSGSAGVFVRGSNTESHRVNLAPNTFERIRQADAMRKNTLKYRDSELSPAGPSISQKSNQAESSQMAGHIRQSLRLRQASKVDTSLPIAYVYDIRNSLERVGHEGGARMTEYLKNIELMMQSIKELENAIFFFVGGESYGLPQDHIPAGVKRMHIMPKNADLSVYDHSGGLILFDLGSDGVFIDLPVITLTAGTIGRLDLEKKAVDLETRDQVQRIFQFLTKDRRIRVSAEDLMLLYDMDVDQFGRYIDLAIKSIATGDIAGYISSMKLALDAIARSA